MSRILFFTALLCSVVIHSVHGDDDVAQVEGLIRDIQKELPNGWTVEFKVAEHYLGSMRPVVLISSAEELPIEFVVPSPPPGEPEIQREKAAMWLAFMPYLAPLEFDAARQRNDDRTHQRLQFVEADLKDVPFAGKVGDTEPKPPWGFSPRSATERRFVQQYAFLWLATEPEQLPSHRYGTLSMWFGRPPITIHDDQRDKEFQQIAEGVQHLLTPYEGVEGR